LARQASVETGKQAATVKSLMANKEVRHPADCWWLTAEWNRQHSEAIPYQHVVSPAYDRKFLLDFGRLFRDSPDYVWGQVP
jgi:hypothetical protein